MDNKEFQRRALESFTRLENGLVDVKEGQVVLKKDIQFLHDDVNSKFEMLANAIKELVEKMQLKRSMREGLET
jgi:hypothetical protein